MQRFHVLSYTNMSIDKDIHIMMYLFIDIFKYISQSLTWLFKNLFFGTLSICLFKSVTKNRLTCCCAIEALRCGCWKIQKITLIMFKAVSETTNRQIESVNRERESVATLLFFGIHYRILLSTITFEFRTISVSVSPLIFLQRYWSSPIEIERYR